ncbi:hypothetical protein FOL80_01315 [Lactobacillus reuteri]|uniref:hypothetical protein n=1 Tax=Limosilactobacillus reuteri TaxID=1598 RepID=UPI00146F798B|nr:hypothetical protein [Limosilactobacillus reuteri]NMV48353.1 hypothetical protein [Limosilactobacillus reuteri]NMV49987.1 hypothetical protein [Limosilactobacillus reuteri]NMV59123.1 hypothetical protein [Limosilactobacillus reuteri]NMV60933.1 hypothetical protein [Limosilactobacillus reuteri]NMV62683.1 hypothetical protein [Limosilactobacillus reuteri]
MEELSLKTPSKAELIEVIHTVAIRGKGVHSDPIRNVDQYWSKDGKLLAEKDIIRDMEVTHGKIKEQK